MASSESSVSVRARSIVISGASPMAEVALRDVDGFVLSSGKADASGRLVAGTLVSGVYLGVIDKVAYRILIE